MSTYPPGSVTLTGTNLTASYFLSQPSFVARRLRALADLRYVGSNLLRGRATSTGGAVGYEVAGESIFAAGALWTSATPKILLDVMKAQAAMAGLNLGYQADTLLVDDTVWAFLAADTTIATLMARESLNNPVYTGRFSALAGLDVVHVPAANMPGADGTSAWLIDSQSLGFIATEDLGGGYQAAGDLVESKVIRQDENDAWRLRARVNFAAAVTDPGAGYKITGVR
jgi:hypothetical protein